MQQPDVTLKRRCEPLLLCFNRPRCSRNLLRQKLLILTLLCKSARSMKTLRGWSRLIRLWFIVHFSRQEGEAASQGFMLSFFFYEHTFLKDSSLNMLIKRSMCIHVQGEVWDNCKINYCISSLPTGRAKPRWQREKV